MAIESQNSKAAKSKLYNWSKFLVVKIALIFGVFFIVIAQRWSNGGFTPAANSLLAQGAGHEGSLQVNWPEKHSRYNLNFTNREPREHISPAVNLRIPKEYLDVGGTYFDKNKGIEELSIGFELPGAASFQNHPGWELYRDPVVDVRFKEKLLVRSFLRLKRDKFYIPERVMSDFTSRTSSGYFISDGLLAGLIRYSSQTCLSGSGVDHPEVVNFVAGKKSDDVSKIGCRINRTNMELISVPSDDIGDFATVSCVGAICHLGFDIIGRVAVVSVKSKDLISWRAIISSARTLVHGFIMPEGVLQVEDNAIYIK